MVYESVVPGNGETLSASLYPGALALKVGEQEVYSLDGEGRLLGAFTGGRWLRRGLDNTVVEKRAQAFTSGWQALARRDADRFLDGVSARMAELHRAVSEDAVMPAGAAADPSLREAIVPWLARAAKWDSRRSRLDAGRFLRIYRRVTILPPDQYLSVVLQPTEGCRYNRCTFCDLYRDRPFRIKTAEEFRQHIEEVIAFFGRGLARRRSLFLGDANALSLPTADLLAVFRAMHERFAVAPIDLASSAWRRWLGDHAPGFDGIYSFLDVFTGRRKSAGEYGALRELGLRRVTIGLESGHAPLLRFLRKPGRPDDAVELVHTLREAGLSAAVIVMVGVGGTRYAEGHVHDTAAALNAMGLGAGDLVYLSEFVDRPGSDYAAHARAEGIEPLDAGAAVAQGDAIRGLLRFAGEPPRVSVYRLTEFIY